MNGLEKVAVSRMTHRDTNNMAEQTFAEPTWKANHVSADQSVVVTPCMPIAMRLMEVRIPWEPSSFLEDNDRKNMYVELRDPMIRAYLQRQEDVLSKESWGQLSSCLAKEGMLRCKISIRNVHMFDKDRRACATPTNFANLICNVLVKVIGKWQTPDGSAMGLNLQATDVQMLRVSERECPF